MPATPTLQDLQDRYILPILSLPPDATSHPPEPLAHLQCHIIDMSRTLFYPCATPTALAHALALSLTVPHLRKVWEDAAALGFPTPLSHTA